MKLCFLLPRTPYYRYFYYDLNENEIAITMNRKISAIRKVCNKLFHKRRCPDFLYLLCYLILKKEIDFQSVDVLVVLDTAQKAAPYGFFKWLRDRFPDMKTVLMLENKISTLYGLDGNIDMGILPNRDLMLPYDLVFSYDEEEANKFGFIYYEILSNLTGMLPCTNTNSHDICYCGSIGKQWKLGRYQALNQVYNYLQENGVSCEFRLVFGKEVDVPPDCKYAYRTYISYPEMIAQELASNVILEIVSDNKHGITSRFYEALMYNKKLLTNNDAIRQNKYFHPEYMRVFRDVQDIDIAWIKDSNPIDYHYSNEFTPKGFYHTLEKLLDCTD